MGWPALLCIASAFGAILIVWRWRWPSLFTRWIGGPVRGPWRGWHYRRHWRTARNEARPARSAFARRTVLAMRLCAGGGRAAASCFANGREGGNSPCNVLPSCCQSSGHIARHRTPNGSRRANSGRTTISYSRRAGAGPSNGRRTGRSGRRSFGRLRYDARLHDARHTAGTLLVEQGVHIRVIQEVLGHARVTTTEGYTHVASPQVRDVTKRMGAALWGDG